MKFYSLNGHPREVSFEEAVCESIAPDNGLFFPKTILPVDNEVIQSFYEMPREKIAYEAIKQFIGCSIPKSELKKIIRETLSFEFPIVRLHDNLYALELFHGPTLAFKDVGARFMARCLRYFYSKRKQNTTILTATSGDTGGAVANGFYGVEGTQVMILYPKGRVSPLQERQMTTLGGNITAVAVEGSFDDCQAIVKKAFSDVKLKKAYGLVSANSINVARWLPQMFYYIFALQKFENKPVVFSVPSGNFGNICAGMIAKRIGFPIKKFIASNNRNNVVHRYLKTRKYEPAATISTLSNAMDVGKPSNFIRIQRLYNDFEHLKKHLSSATYNDIQTSEALLMVKKKYDYLMDTHGAIGYLGIKDYLNKEHSRETIGIFLETAHPAKFIPVIEPIIDEKVRIPKGLESLMNQKESTHSIPADYSSFQSILKELLLKTKG